VAAVTIFLFNFGATKAHIFLADPPIRIFTP